MISDDVYLSFNGKTAHNAPPRLVSRRFLADYLINTGMEKYLYILLNKDFLIENLLKHRAYLEIYKFFSSNIPLNISNNIQLYVEPFKTVPFISYNGEKSIKLLREISGVDFDYELHKEIATN